MDVSIRDNIMKLSKTTKKNVYGVKLSLKDGRKEVGRVFLYILKNELHKVPFGFLEDVFVDEKYRGQGLGGQLVKAAIAEAKKRKCYKLIGTSRNSKKELHSYYEKFGFKQHGVELRMDFK